MDLTDKKTQKSKSKNQTKEKETIPKQIQIKPGKLANGRLIYKGSPAPVNSPARTGFTNIYVMIHNEPLKNQYGELSPYFIRVPVKKQDGSTQMVIHENYWQFLKVYPSVPDIKQTSSTHDKRVVWVHPAEIHFDQDQDRVLPAWFKWNEKGFACQDWVRFPVGSHPKMRASCKFSLTVSPDGTIDQTKRLNYVEGRKQVYGKAYCENVVKHKLFAELVQRLQSGENLCIVEVDGPHKESTQYYTEMYGWPSNIIENDTIEATPDILKTLINDTKHPFGHGYCLSMALFGDDIVKFVSE